MHNQDQANSIFGDKDTLLILYGQVSENARYVVDKIWTNVRFFATLTSALITLTVMIMISMMKGQVGIIPAPIRLVLIFIPLINIALSILGIKNLAREYKRFLDWIAALSKIQEKLGLYERTRFRTFQKDKYILPERFSQHAYSSTEDFIEAMMKSKSSIYYYFKILHWIYVTISVFLAIVILILAMIY